jgi:hypothetical protein
LTGFWLSNGSLTEQVAPGAANWHFAAALVQMREDFRLEDARKREN